MICNKSDADSIQLCIENLKNNKVLILPTDTVYGFSSLANGENDFKIKQIKGRDENKPFIQLISDPSEIKKYSDEQIPEEILKFWPGPLTIIVEDKRLQNSQNKTTAFRCPGDEWLREIIKGCGNPIYSTSVNRSGRPVLELEKDIISEFEKETDLIVLDGDKKNGVPSTIIKIENGKVIVLRQGELKLN